MTETAPVRVLSVEDSQLVARAERFTMQSKVALPEAVDDPLVAQLRAEEKAERAAQLAQAPPPAFSNDKVGLNEESLRWTVDGAQWLRSVLENTEFDWPRVAERASGIHLPVSG